jgi:uncharacterized protein YabE (DUF348 family)
MSLKNYKKLLERLNSKKFIISFVTIIIAGIVSIVTYANMKTVTLIVDGQANKFTTFSNTVSEVLEDKKVSIGPKDKVLPVVSTRISKNDVITIKRAVNIKVIVEGKELNILSSEDTVDSVLNSEDIQVKPEDKVNPSKDTKLSENMNIEIIRVETKSFTKPTPISYKNIVKYDSNLASTQRKTIQDGKEGLKQVTTIVTYENGKEVARKISGEKVVRKPQDKIVVQGTMKKMHVSRGANQLSYSKILNSKATAYYAFRGIGKTYTSTGRVAVRDPDGYSTIAVDPRVIPYGTKLYVEGYGYAIAADTGGAIKGNKIDVYFDTRSEAYAWGVKHVDVYVLND